MFQETIGNFSGCLRTVDSTPDPPAPQVTQQVGEGEGEADHHQHLQVRRGEERVRRS